MSEYNKYHKPPSSEGDLARRFSLRTLEGSQDDHSSVEILRTIRRGYESFDKAHPGSIIGLTAYGSLVKGRGHANSDADVTVFCEPDYEEAVRQESIEIDNLLTLDTSGGQFSKLSPQIYRLDENTLKTYCESTLLDVARRGVFSGSVNDLQKSLFHLGIGTFKLQKYRQIVADTFSTQPAFADRAIESLMSAVIEKEELRRQARVYTPKTFNEFISYYGLEHPLNQTQKISGLGHVAMGLHE